MASKDNRVNANADPYRPQLHFSPVANWINDPNGLVFHDGEYHLFYQYHPDSTLWGPMHWGHAVSPDLITWQELPIALYPDELGTIFSGSAVIDQHNTAGFGEDAMIAIFTHHVHEGHRQRQSIAYSMDNGRTWTKYAGNPVLDTPADTRDFRDPKVFWYGDYTNGHWVMCLAVGHAIHFYTSPNLRDWLYSGRFGDTFGCTVGVWETPDLVELGVDDTDERRWVLLVGVGDGAPAGGSGQQYFVGHFDGNTFTSENAPNVTLWADYGADFYAAQSWSNQPGDEYMIIAWMNNWRYARNLPTVGWRGAMTLPRAISLRTTRQGLRLRQAPVAPVHSHTVQTEERGHAALALSGAAWQIDVCVTLPNPAQDTVTLSLGFGDGRDRLLIRYESAAQVLVLDRAACGEVDFHPEFAAAHCAPLSLDGNVLDLQLIVDASSLELFAHDGLLAMTELIYPSSPLSTVTVDVDAPGASIGLRAGLLG